jgi:hypothetical protein
LFSSLQKFINQCKVLLGYHTDFIHFISVKTKIILVCSLEKFDKGKV